GMTRAKAKGIKIGRPRLAVEIRQRIVQRAAKGETAYAIAKDLGIDRHTAAKYAKIGQHRGPIPTKSAVSSFDFRPQGNDMTLPTVFEPCEPRQGVPTGTIAEADFAAALAKVIRGPASDDYQIPARFFANTYPTAGLRNLLRNVLARLTGAPGAAA